MPALQQERSKKVCFQRRKDPKSAIVKKAPMPFLVITFLVTTRNTFPQPLFMLLPIPATKASKKRHRFHWRGEKRTHRVRPPGWFLPNIVTMAALCLGLTSLRLTLLAKWEWAVIAILAAAILDGLDGRLARLLGASSDFGAQLDCLSDFIAFGVAPPFLLYVWHFHKEKKGWGWVCVLFFATCMALRLARFAVLSKRPVGHNNMFSVGVPAPAGAFLALMPMIITFSAKDLEWIEEGVHACFASTFDGFSLIVISLLLISRIPTFVMKEWSPKPHYMIPLLGAFALLMACLVQALWPTLLVLGILYIVSIPFSAWSARPQKAPDIPKPLRS